MFDQLAGEIDIIDEMHLRRMARENYVLAAQRHRNWHPVVLDEMQRRDRELIESTGIVDKQERLRPADRPLAIRRELAQFDPHPVLGA